MPINHQSTTDKWVKCISASGTIRAIAVTATETTQLMAKRHSLDAISSKALGEATIAALILSSYCKSGEKVNLNIKGSGWCHQAIIDANADAEVRGYVVPRPQDQVHLGKDIGPWGIGLLSVLRTKTDATQPYVGTVPLITGRLPKDLTFYWLQSEQVQSAVGIDVFIDQDGITHAEGFLIQALPGASDQDISFIENHLKKFHQFNDETPNRDSPIGLLAYLLREQTFSILEEKNLTLKCPCSLDRVKRSLNLVGHEELQSMADDHKDFEILCDFCSEKYVFSHEMLTELAKASKKN